MACWHTPSEKKKWIFHCLGFAALREEKIISERHASIREHFPGPLGNEEKKRRRAHHRNAFSLSDCVVRRSRAQETHLFLNQIYASQNARDVVIILHDICCAISTSSARRFDEEVFVLFVFVVLFVVANGEDENLRHGDREGR